jgi:hypothetical protein
MSTIQGIHFENDTNGDPIVIKIDLAIYGDILEPFLIQVGIIEADNKFDKDWQKGVLFDELLSQAKRY